MTCPFEVGISRLFCGASQIAYFPSQRIKSEYCSDNMSDRYRYCEHYRYAVWGGLSAVSPPERQPRSDE